MQGVAERSELPVGAERTRARVLLLCLLGLYGAAVERLIRVQLGDCDAHVSKVDRRTERRFHDAPARGRILDRHGRVLAEDLPVFEARGEVYLARTADAEGEALLAGQARTLADEIANCLLAGDAPTALRVELRHKLVHRIQEAVAASVERRRRAPAPGRSSRLKVDFLIADDLRSASAVEALVALERRGDWPLHLHLTTRHERTYPGGEACLGPVGFVADRGCATELRTRLEALDGLRGGVPGSRQVRVGPRRQRYWSGTEKPARAADSVITTLDLDLQRAAHAELATAVQEATAEGGAAPSWGALVLADVETGDVLAMASHVTGSHPRAAAFAPTQRLFEPGSVVKPLVFALVLQRGLVDWHDEVVDCSEGAPGRGWRVRPPDDSLPRGSRPIVDDHANGTLSPAEVLVRSSNVGAVKIGLRLGVDGLEDYVRFYRFGQRTAINLPGEAQGRCKADLAALSKKQFWYYTAPSYCFGYELMVTPVQMLRAYLALLAREQRELRLVAAAEVDGVRIDLPSPAQPSAQPLLRPAQLELLKEAMASVVSDADGATGRQVAAMLDELGVAPGVVAGKTGTSVNKHTQVRTASFAGFAPVTAPRYLAFCVLQKDRAEGFYGGRYAAPAATRLLLHALGVPIPGTAAARGATRAQPVRAAVPVRRAVASAESMTGR